MQETNVQRVNKRNRVKIPWYVRLLGGVAVLGAVFLLGVIVYFGVIDTDNEPIESVSPTVSTETQEPVIFIDGTEEIEAPIQGVADPNNTVYPYSMMAVDWGIEVYEQGYKYHEIPNSYKMAGGMFPEVAQIYLWSICREAGVDYYIALALIERESGYRYYAVGDSGNSKGLMQVQERWHKDRMTAVGATDLFNPYDNMRVAVNFLKEIQDIYLDSSGEHCVLMVYNMGASGANKLWAEGIYNTAYTSQILQRAQEIKQELQDK